EHHQVLRHHAERLGDVLPHRGEPGRVLLDHRPREAALAYHSVRDLRTAADVGLHYPERYHAVPLTLCGSLCPSPQNGHEDGKGSDQGERISRREPDTD